MIFNELIKVRNRENYTKLLGAKTVEMEEGYAKVELQIKEKHYNGIQSVHGGCIFSLADIAVGSASIGGGEKGTTINANLNYLAPAIDVEKLTAEATETKKGKTICVYDVTIKDENNTLIAIGTFPIYNLSSKNKNNNK